MAARYTPVITYQPIFREVIPLETVYAEIPTDIKGIFQDFKRLKFYLLDSMLSYYQKNVACVLHA